MIPGLSQGQVEKMKIEAYRRDTFRPTDLIERFEVMFNPNQYTRRYAVRVPNTDAPGDNAANPQAMGSEAQEMNFEFLFDGTGVAKPKLPGGMGVSAPGLGLISKALGGGSNPFGDNVHAMVERFLRLTYRPNAEIHAQPYLKLNWGVLEFKCKLKSADVDYTLFTPDAQPLRAKVKAVFVEYVPTSERPPTRSPDLTRRVDIAEDDRLPNLSDKVYDDPSYYLALAKVNKLNNFRRLKTGTILRMPPLRNTPE